MQPWQALATLVIGTMIGSGGVWLAREYARRRDWLDVPNERSFHETPVPRVGGLGMLLPFMLALPVLLFVLPASLPVLLAALSALLIAAFSFLDDWRDLSRWLRFCVHGFLAAVVLWLFASAWAGGSFPLFGDWLPSWLATLLLLIWITGLINAYNFMDGIDGIAALQGLVAILGWLSVAFAMGHATHLPFSSGYIPLLLLCGGLLGFLFFNWAPASIFMGDSGSTFLGGYLAMLPLVFASQGLPLERALEAGVFFLWPFVADTGTTFVRRLWKREQIFEAHRTHLYQELAATFPTREAGHRLTSVIFATLALIGVLLYWTPGPVWAKGAICAWLWIALAFWTYGLRRKGNIGLIVRNSESEDRVKATENSVATATLMDFDIYLSPPEITEAEKVHVAKAFASGFIAPVGPQLNAFEKGLADHLGVPDILALSSGTAANHLGLRGIGVGPGDCVLCPDLTFIATVNPVRYLGAEPVLVDVDPSTWSMDPARMREAIETLQGEGRRVKAAVIVHPFGIPAPMEELLSVAREFGVRVLEDCAGAFGTMVGDQPAGTLSDAGAFSFNGNKVLTTSGGGALWFRDQSLFQEARSWANQGKEPGVVGYVHESLGYNYKLSNICAAVGLGQLETVRNRLRRKAEVFRAYAALFADREDILLMPEPAFGRNNYWLTCIGFIEEGRAPEIVRKLRAEGIESSPMWQSMHRQSINHDLRCFGGEGSRKIAAHFICLPSGTTLSNEDIDRIASRVLD
ncbi:MAG: aminotransferase class I/II-fold pyridoxal phosphate-dependent enzyme [Verrucomicrobia bacterium]|jgi:pyridoxal phosphate-dependent aminotransferase EpsN|nr:aminotransferase class I/II-fold pyridoxal phosphate-dependent enzyme [Verrucomicrobiota bacterium]